MTQEARAAVTVKPLEWCVGSHKTDDGDHIADTILGQYSCRNIGRDRWTLWFRERCISDKPHGVRETYTLEGAKAAAQADYECRILSALDTKPVDVAEAARVLMNSPEAICRLFDGLYDGHLDMFNVCEGSIKAALRALSEGEKR